MGVGRVTVGDARVRMVAWWVYVSGELSLRWAPPPVRCLSVSCYLRPV